MQGLGGVRSLVSGGRSITLCDPIWQVTSRSSEMESYIGLYLFAIKVHKTLHFYLKIQTKRHTSSHVLPLRAPRTLDSPAVSGSTRTLLQVCDEI